MRQLKTRKLTEAELALDRTKLDNGRINTGIPADGLLAQELEVSWVGDTIKGYTGTIVQPILEPAPGPTAGDVPPYMIEERVSPEEALAHWCELCKEPLDECRIDLLAETRLHPIVRRYLEGTGFIPIRVRVVLPDGSFHYFHRLYSFEVAVLDAKPAVRIVFENCVSEMEVFEIDDPRFTIELLGEEE